METTINNSVKKYFLLPESLYKKADEISEELGMNFSQFIREALENYVAQIEKKKIEHEIAEACKFYSDIDKQIASEWRPTEGRI